MKNLKYIALGILVGYLTPYALILFKSLSQKSAAKEPTNDYEKPINY